MNVLKRPCEDGLVVVLAALGRVKDGCEDGLAVVLAASDQTQRLCHVAAGVWVPPKEREPPDSAAIQRHSKYGQ